VGFEQFSRELKQFSDFEEELNFVIETLKHQGEGYEIYYYQAKHQVLDRIGAFSVKVIIPKLIPFYDRDTNAVLGAERLYNITTQKKDPVAYKKIQFNNQLPHPFP